MDFTSVALNLTGNRGVPRHLQNPQTTNNASASEQKKQEPDNTVFENKTSIRQRLQKHTGSEIPLQKGLIDYTYGDPMGSTCKVNYDVKDFLKNSKEIQKELNKISASEMNVIEKIFHIESKGDYSSINKSRHIGAGQMSTAAHLELGMVEKKDPQEKIKGNKWNKVEWTGMYGIDSKKEFLQNPSVQKIVMKKALELSAKQLKYLGGKELIGTPIIKDGKDTGKKWTHERLIVLSHLLGATGAYKCASTGEDRYCKVGSNKDGREYIDFLDDKSFKLDIKIEEKPSKKEK